MASEEEELYLHNVNVTEEGALDQPFGVVFTNMSQICVPLQFSVGINYLSKQLILTMGIAFVTNVILKPIGVPTYVSHLIAGFVTGSSVLGYIQGYRSMLAPISTSIVLDTYSAIAMLYQLFLVGVQVNPALILKARKKAVIIGVLVVVVPMGLGSLVGFALAQLLNLKNTEITAVMTIAALQSISSFPVIVFYMYELSIVSLEFSHLAYSSSMITGLVCALVTGSLTFSLVNEGPAEVVVSSLSHVANFTFILYAFRPYVNWAISRVPEGQTMKELYMIPVYLGVLVTGIICGFGNVNWLFGPFFYGMIVPSGSSIGTTLVKRFELFNTWMMAPIFFFSYGMMIDLPTLHSNKSVVTGFVVLTTYVGKFIGAALPALYNNMSRKEAILLGLTVNVQGFLEVINYRTFKVSGIIDVQSFQIMSSTMIIMTLILTPILKYLYNKLLNIDVYERGTQLIEPSVELRVLACVYSQENVPSIIHLLKALNPTRDKPVNLNLIHFVERVGHAAPVIINHTEHSQPSSTTAGSQRIINVFKKYEDHNSQSISIHPYTVVSHHTSLSNDVCKLAERQGASLIVLPFHKELTTGIVNSDLRTVNCEVLDQTSCSVGILLDRGLLGGTKFVFENWTSYHVVLFFFGGADDQEALAYSTRMVTHPTIELTVIRFLSDYPNPTYSAKMEMTIDEEIIRGFRQTHAYNDRVTFVEEDVEDGLGVIKIFESLEGRFDLIVLGRQHDQNSPLILGLTEWNESSEIGTIGDIFATSDYGGKSTIFIVQQQKNAARHAGSFAEDDEVMLHKYEEEEVVPFRGEDSISSCSRF